MENDKTPSCVEAHAAKVNACSPTLSSTLDFVAQIPQKLQSSMKVYFGSLMKHNRIFATPTPLMVSEEQLYCVSEVNLDKQLQAWKSRPDWSDEPPEIKVSVPKGSLCNLSVRFKAGLPPDAVYNILIDPKNKRVFKNVKEVISRKVLLDEGSIQVVELEQAAIWRFLWWSGTISVHLFVEQNRKDHTVKFKQGRSGFMERFEGCWKTEPLLVDEPAPLPHKPKNRTAHASCTDGRGRVGSIVTLDQLVQPALVPPPPISWYLRGITTRTTQMLINDLLAETARLRGAADDVEKRPNIQATRDVNDIKERWRRRRRKTSRHRTCSG